MSHKEDLLLFLPIFLISFIFYIDYGINLHGDGAFLYAYERSLFFDHDLNFTNEYYSSSEIYNRNLLYTYRLETFKTKTGYSANFGLIGMSLLVMPIYFLGHLFTLLINLFGASYPINGYSIPYQISFTFGSFFYGIVGIFIIYKTCRLFFNKTYSLLGTISTFLGTFILFYIIFNPSYSHAVSMFSVSLFFYFWVVYFLKDEKISFKRLAILGILGGLMIMVRIVNGVFLILPALTFIKLFRKTQKSSKYLTNLIIKISIFSIFLILTFIPQFISWYLIFGHPLAYIKYIMIITSEGTHILEILFSFNHGLFTWSPLMIISLIGLYYLLKYNKEITIVLWLLFILVVYSNSRSAQWWAGASFGMRRFDNMILPFSLGAVSFINHFFRKTMKFKIIISILLLVFILFNFYLVYLCLNNIDSIFTCAGIPY
jgi:hypothetical protein